MSELDWLMAWYEAQCNGEWEYQYGVQIETLDNPGWLLKIDLHETDLSGRAFSEIESGAAGVSPWWSCRVIDNRWQAACGARDLATVIRIFKDWAQP